MAALRSFRLAKSKSYNCLDDEGSSVQTDPGGSNHNGDEDKREKSSKFSNQLNDLHFKAAKKQKGIIYSAGSRNWNELDNEEDRSDGSGFKDDRKSSYTGKLNSKIARFKSNSHLPDMKFPTTFKFESKGTNKSSSGQQKKRFEEMLSLKDKLKIFAKSKHKFSAEPQTSGSKDYKISELKDQSTEIIDIIKANSTEISMEIKAIHQQNDSWDPRNIKLKAVDNLDQQLLSSRSFNLESEQKRNMFEGDKVQRVLKDRFDEDRWHDSLIEEKEVVNSATTSDAEENDELNNYSDGQESIDEVFRRNQLQMKKEISLTSGLKIPSLNLDSLKSSPNKSSPSEPSHEKRDADTKLQKTKSTAMNLKTKLVKDIKFNDIKFGASRKNLLKTSYSEEKSPSKQEEYISFNEISVPSNSNVSPKKSSPIKRLIDSSPSKLFKKVTLKNKNKLSSDPDDLIKFSNSPVKNPDRSQSMNFDENSADFQRSGDSSSDFLKLDSDTNDILRLNTASQDSALGFDDDFACLRSNVENPFQNIDPFPKSFSDPFESNCNVFETSDIFHQKESLTHLHNSSSQGFNEDFSTWASTCQKSSFEPEYKASESSSESSVNDSGFDSRDFLSETAKPEFNEDFFPDTILAPPKRVKNRNLARQKFSFSSTNLSQSKRWSPTGLNKQSTGSMWDCSYEEEDAVMTPRRRANRMKVLEHKATHFIFSKLVSSGKMSTQLPEEASLLGGDVEELKGIQLTLASGRCLESDGTLGEKVTVDTEHGSVVVHVRGDANKPVIITYHDLGLNSVVNFQNFFHHPDMNSLLQCFRVVSVNARGMEEGAESLPEGYVYPSMDQLAETVEKVRAHLCIRSFIGFGVGMGANILARYALEHLQYVDALCLVNCCASTSGWVEWGYQKLNIRHLRSGTMTTGAVDYLMWHSFGRVDTVSHDITRIYKDYFEKSCNATNLSHIIEAYVQRNDLGIVRELDLNKKKDVRMLRCPVLNITSNESPHVDASVAFNGRLDPTNSSWMKIQDAGMVIEERPAKVIEAFKLFLQGEGYVVGSSRRASAVSPGHIQAVHANKLKSRQNSLPLIRDVPLHKENSLASTEEETAEEVTENSEINKSSDEVIVKNGGASDNDIRITENPLEQPAAV